VTDTFARWRPHPWHGLSAGPAPPSVVSVYVEITPFDLVKYEVDKATGYLRVDRAQRTSSLPPAVYGFIPHTYVGPSVAALLPGSRKGDGDPLDVCVLCERPIDRAEVILDAQVVGGLPMLDHEEADDKIVAILCNDPVYRHITEIAQVPAALLDRLIHYFSTYKLTASAGRTATVGAPYGRAHAEAVIRAAIADYDAAFGNGQGSV
jgi:inorganic pyrophosphatase